MSWRLQKLSSHSVHAACFIMEPHPLLLHCQQIIIIMKRSKCCRCWKLRIPPTWLVLCAAIVVQLGFGFYPVLVKKLAIEEDANPYIFSSYRAIGSLPVLVLCTLVAERRIPIPRPKMALVFMVLGLTEAFASHITYVAAIYKVGPSIASAMQPVIPVWTTLLAVLTCTEKLTSPKMLHAWTKLLGIVLVSGGAIEVGLTGIGSANTASSSVGDQLLGYFFLFLNTFTTAIFLVVQKRFIFNQRDCIWREHPVAVSTYATFFGVVFTALVFVYFIATGQTKEFKIPLQTIFALEYAIYVNSVISYMLIVWTVVHLPSIVASAFFPLQVLITVAASYFIVEEKLTLWQYAGIVVVLMGVILVIFSNYMDERAARGRRVVRLDSCHCCHKTYVPLVNASQEEESIGDTESHTPQSDVTVSESIELENLGDVSGARASSEAEPVSASPLTVLAADQEQSVTEHKSSSETNL